MRILCRKQNIIFYLCSSVKEIARNVGDRVISLVNSNPNCNLGLSFSRETIEVYRNLIIDYNENKTNYKGVSTYNLSEFYSNEQLKWTYKKLMKKYFFNFINIKEKNTYYPFLTTNYEASKYDRLIWKNGGIDLELFSINGNGDIGYNQENSDPTSLTHVSQISTPLRKKTLSLFGEKVEDTPDSIVTMGIRTILNAKSIIAIATDKESAKAIANLWNDKQDPKMACTYLSQHPDITVYLTKSAASQLKIK